MLTEDSFFHLKRFLGQLPCRDHPVSRLGDQGSAAPSTDATVFYKHRFSGISRKTPSRSMTEAGQVFYSLGHYLPKSALTVDWPSISSTVEDNEISNHCSLYTRESNCAAAGRRSHVYVEPKKLSRKAVLLEHLLLESRCFTLDGRALGERLRPMVTRFI